MIDVDQLLELAACGPAEIVDIPDVGKVKVRPLSGAEVLALGKVADDQGARAVFLLHKGLADPELDLGQAQQFVDTAAFGPLDQLLKEILRVSGLSEGAQKSGGAGTADG